jgi:hypothetical protein
VIIYESEKQNGRLLKNLNAVKNLPPTEFGGVTVAQFATQDGLSRDKRAVVIDKINEKLWRKMTATTPTKLLLRCVINLSMV